MSKNAALYCTENIINIQNITTCFDKIAVTA